MWKRGLLVERVCKRWVAFSSYRRVGTLGFMYMLYSYMGPLGQSSYNLLELATRPWTDRAGLNPLK